MRDLRHSGPSPKPGHSPALLGHSAELATSMLQTVCVNPILTRAVGVTKMRPKMLLYMLNMLHM